MTTAAPMYVPPSALDPVERAMSYPYAIPDCSFVFDKAGWRPAAIDAALTIDRHPVIACGSNRSPDQLARKYFDFGAVTIPVQRAWLAEFDVVYAAHITRLRLDFGLPDAVARGTGRSLRHLALGRPDGAHARHRRPGAFLRLCSACPALASRSKAAAPWTPPSLISIAAAR